MIKWSNNAFLPVYAKIDEKREESRGLSVEKESEINLGLPHFGLL